MSSTSSSRSNTPQLFQSTKPVKREPWRKALRTKKWCTSSWSSLKVEKSSTTCSTLVSSKTILPEPTSSRSWRDSKPSMQLATRIETWSRKICFSMKNSNLKLPTSGSASTSQEETGPGCWRRTLGLNSTWLPRSTKRSTITGRLWMCLPVDWSSLYSSHKTLRSEWQTRQVTNGTTCFVIKMQCFGLNITDSKALDSTMKTSFHLSTGCSLTTTKTDSQ